MKIFFYSEEGSRCTWMDFLWNTEMIRVKMAPIAR